MTCGRKPHYRKPSLVGRTPWSAAGPLAGFLRQSTKADEGVGQQTRTPHWSIFILRGAPRRISTPVREAPPPAAVAAMSSGEIPIGQSNFKIPA